MRAIPHATGGRIWGEIEDLIYKIGGWVGTQPRLVPPLDTAASEKTDARAKASGTSRQPSNCRSKDANVAQ